MIKWPLVIREVVGHSMQPKLNAGDFVLASPWLKIKKGDVIVARYDEIDIIKRVAQLTDIYVLLTGDNKSDSKDSRVYGELPRKHVLGKVFYVAKPKEKE